MVLNLVGSAPRGDLDFEGCGNTKGVIWRALGRCGGAEEKRRSIIDGVVVPRVLYIAEMSLHIYILSIKLIKYPNAMFP